MENVSEDTIVSYKILLDLLNQKHCLTCNLKLISKTAQKLYNTDSTKFHVLTLTIIEIPVKISRVPK